jgi:hypothetical protein
METLVFLVSLFLSIFVLVAVAQLFTIRKFLHRLLLVELCREGVFEKAYCDAYKRELAAAVLVRIKQ